MKKLQNLLAFTLVIIVFGLVLQTISITVKMNINHNTKIIYDLVKTLGFITLGILLGIQSFFASKSNGIVPLINNKKRNFIALLLLLLPFFLLYIDFGLPYPNSIFLSNFIAFYIYDSNSIFFEIWCITAGYYSSIIISQNFKTSV